MKALRTTLLTAVGTAALLTAYPALAQAGSPSPAPTGQPGATDAQPEPQTDAVGTPSAVQGTPAEARPEGQPGVGDIIVTAQRRDQKLQDVPIAISAVTADTAKQFGTVSTDSLTNSVPSLQFSRQSGVGVVPFLRGVGSTESVGAESEVAVYVDDVYVGNSSAIDFQFNNINSIEVLKGPQGTLFGRNATGGVIHVRTRAPSQEPKVDAQVGYGSFDTVYGNFYANAGLTDTLAVNFAATGRDQRDGYGHNLVTGRDTLRGWNYAFRGKLLWQPTDATSLTVTGDYSNQYDEAGTNVRILPGTVAVGGGTAPADRFGTYAAPGDFQRVKTWRLSGKLNQEVGDMTLVAISAYTDTRQQFRLDLDGSPTGVDLLTTATRNPAHAFSQELQLQSPSDEAFNWIVGAFYYNSKYTLNQRLSGTLQAANGGYRDLTAPLGLNSYSGFVDASYKFLPNTTFTGGLRYTSDRYTIDFQTLTATGILARLPQQAETFSKLTWRGVLDHRFSPDVMAYASVSRGFKSGRFNVSDGKPVRPETLDAYEIGTKTDLFDGKVRLNLAGFHYDFRDIQVSQTVVGVSQVLNAGRARINGADVDFTFVPTSDFSITAGLAFLDAKYTAFPAGVFNVPNPAVCTPTPQSTGAPTGGFRACTVDLKGKNLPRSPKFTANLGASYTIRSGIGDFLLNGSLYHNSGFFWEADNNFTQPNYDLLSASVTWTSPDKKLEVRAYGKNMTNEYYYNFVSSGSLRAAGSPAMPDNYGVELTVHF